MWATGTSRARGFTLIEILVVVAIVAVVTAAAVLSIGLASGERAVESEGRRLLELVKLACERAAVTGRDYGLEASHDRYGFKRAQVGLLMQEAAGELRERLLPDDITLEIERDGHAVDAPLRGTADCSLSGSIPRANRSSRRRSTGGRPRPRRRNAITLKAGRCPS